MGRWNKNKNSRTNLMIIKIKINYSLTEGSVTLSYLFMRDKFGWMISDYNLYASTNVVVQIFGNIIGIYILSKMFGVSEFIIAMIAYGSSMAEYIIVGLAAYSWELYLGNLL